MEVVSWLTGFKYFKNSVRCPVFSCLGKEGLQVENLFLHCLFEGQVQDMSDCLKAIPMNFETVHSTQNETFPLDRYALGYCIANCSSTISWKVEMKGDSDKSFMWGLNSNHSGNGIISHLKMTHCDFTCIDSYPLKFLHSIERLEITDLYGLSENIPPMNNLTSLSLKSLRVDNTAMLTPFSNLIHSPKLKCITILRPKPQPIPKSVGDILFGPSSINELTLINCEFEKSFLDSLETNTNLTTVSIRLLYYYDASISNSL